MPILPRRGSSRRRAWIIRYVIGAVVLVVIAGVAYRPATNQYREWKQQRALDQAEAFIEVQDYPNAKLALDVALAAKPGDPEALRVAADLLEQVGSPNVMQLRRRLVTIAPDSTADHAALVMSALRFNDLNAARDAMRGMTPEQANEPVALRAALAYAQATNNLMVADVLYGRLQESEPDNENLQVLQAALRLNSPTPSVVAEARAQLEELRKKPRHSLYITRQLLVNAMLRQDQATAKSLALELRQDDRATLADYLHGANLALNVENRPFPDVFAEILPKIEPTPADAAELLRWLTLIGEADRAQSWLAQQPEAIKADPIVKEVRAELAVAQLAWGRLADLLEDQAWGPVNHDTVQLAFSARLAAERENMPLLNQLWDEALVSAANSLPDLSALYRLASIWGWEDQAETPLWAIVRTFPAQSWAHQTLFNAYRTRRDTENMQALIGTLRIADATTPRYQYDWALLTLLLRQRSTWSDEKQTMQTLYESAPENPYYITGYAFALALSDRAKEAVELADKLAAGDRALPERTPYLAFVYASAMRPAAVDGFIAGSEDFPDFLPEESQLIASARELVR